MPQATPENTEPVQTLEEWWAEDAARVNAMGEAARDAGVEYGSLPKPEKLNADGSLADEADKG
jgi:hypothetical protein